MRTIHLSFVGLPNLLGSRAPLLSLWGNHCCCSCLPEFAPCFCIDSRGIAARCCQGRFAVDSRSTAIWEYSPGTGPKASDTLGCTLIGCNLIKLRLPCSLFAFWLSFTFSFHRQTVMTFLQVKLMRLAQALEGRLGSRRIVACQVQVPLARDVLRPDFAQSEKYRGRERMIRATRGSEL